MLLTTNLALNARTNFQNQLEIGLMFGRNPDLANLSEHSRQFLLNMGLMTTLGAYCLLAMEKESEKAPFSGEIVFDRLLLEGKRMIPHRLMEAGDL